MPAKKKSPAEQIIEKSGHSFHSQVVNRLRELGWFVLVSPYYSDNFTDKPREIDIIAERKFEANDFIHGWLGTVNVRLFIECKYINGDTVFWFDSKEQPRAIERIMKDTGMKDPREDAGMQNHHYFLDVPVAKLFSTEKSRTEDSEFISKAISQNLNSLIYYRNKGDLMPKDKKLRDQVLQRVSYPIIVCSTLDKFSRTDMSDETRAVAPITEPFQLEVNYAYMDGDKNGKNEYFLIDVVDLEKLPELLTLIETTDISAIKEKLAWDKRTAPQPRQSAGQDW